MNKRHKQVRIGNKHNWNVRLTQIIVAAIFSAIISISLAMDGCNIIGVLVAWFGVTYIIAAGIVSISKMFKVTSGIDESGTDSGFIMVLSVFIIGFPVAIYQFVAFPFTTIYYFVKRNKPDEDPQTDQHNSYSCENDEIS